MSNTKTINKATKSAETKRASITTLKTSVEMSKINFESVRRVQTKVCKREDVEKFIKELQSIYSKREDVSFSAHNQKYFYCVDVKQSDKLVAKIWVKVDFVRVCLNKSAFAKIKSIADIENRKAIKKFDNVESVIDNEIALAYSEIVSVLDDVLTTETEKKTK